MECLQYYYDNSDDTNKYNIDCLNMKFNNLLDIDKFNNKDLLEFIDDKYSQHFEEKLVESPFTFSETYINYNNEKICKSRDMSLGPQQKFMGQVMGPSSNFNNMLIYHGLGSGKTCTSIVIAEALKNSTNNRIIYAVPAPLVDQYYEELAGEIRNGIFFSCSSFCLSAEGSDGNPKREFYVSKNKNSILISKQTDLENEILKLKNILIKNRDINILSGLKDTEYAKQEAIVNQKRTDFKLYQSNITNNITKTFEIVSHNTFIGSLYSTGEKGQFIKRDRLLTYDSTLFKKNGLLIIDEIQRLVSAGGTFYKKLYDSIRYYFHPELKLILMSATPIYDNPYELALTINLLRPRVSFPTREADFYKYFIGQITEDGCNRTDNPKKWIKHDSCILNQDLISYICSGYISYFKGGNPNAYPYKRIITIQHPFSNIHKTEYIAALKADISNNKSSDNQPVGVYENILLGNYNNDDDDKISGMFVTSQQYSNIALPREFSSKGLYKTSDEKKIGLKNLKKILSTKKTKLDVIEYVKTISSKFASIVELTLQSTGPVFIFSNWLSFGVEPLALIFEACGLVNFLNDGNKKDGNKFFIWSSETKASDPSGTNTKLARNTFNSLKNIDGGLLKVILGTRSVMEGVSFKNVNQVHITDPWWNESRIEQIMARASRYCSHSNLPSNEQHVDIYRHYSSYPGDGILDDEANIELGGNVKNLAIDTIDQKMLQASLRKYSINNDLEKIIKNCSIDCKLNKNGNIVRLEEHCTPVSGGMYQIYYKNPSNGRMYIRDGIPITVNFSQIYSREFSFPRDDLEINFTEAGFQPDKGVDYITKYDDSPEILDINSINKDLNMPEDIIPWESDKTFYQIIDDLNQPDLKNYIENLWKNFSLIPTLRKNYLGEKVNIDSIIFNQELNSNRNLIDCINLLSKNEMVPKETRTKINEEFNMQSSKYKSNRDVNELIRLGLFSRDYYEDLLNIATDNPEIIKDMLKKTKNKISK